MIRRPPKSTRTATLGPHTALVRSGEHRIRGETPAAFEYVQHVSNLRSHGLRAEDRASWLAAICPEMGISATEDVGETDRSIEQGANQQRCPFLESIAFACLLDMAHDRFRADADRKSTRLNSSH